MGLGNTIFTLSCRDARPTNTMFKASLPGMLLLFIAIVFVPTRAQELKAPEIKLSCGETPDKAFYNGNVTLVCDIEKAPEGKKLLTVTWFKATSDKNRTCILEERSDTLNFTKFEKGNEGEYWCKHRYEGGVKSPEGTHKDVKGEKLPDCKPGTERDAYGVCKACAEWAFGKDCTNKCACDKDDSESCDAVTGKCTCKPQWKGDKCDEDVDECKDVKLYNCTEGSTCNNTHGGYQCDCNANFELDNNKCVCSVGFKFDKSDSTCKACAQWAYGKDCAQKCLCIGANSESCDAATGACTCKPGWKGDKCDEDVDECKDDKLYNCTDYSTCANTKGGYNCDCNKDFEKKKGECVCSSGLELDKSTSTCKAVLKLAGACGTGDTTNYQRELYPFGHDAQDVFLSDCNCKDANIKSTPITFSTKVPFGTEQHEDATVFTSGMVIFGKSYEPRQPTFEFRGEAPRMAAPYWSKMTNVGSHNVTYHLYEAVKSDGTLATVKEQEVIDRATCEVREYKKMTKKNKFEALQVLVTTWTDMEPERWNEQQCKNPAIRKYLPKEVTDTCLTELNTYQSIYVTDTSRAFYIFMYKLSKMTWVFTQGQEIMAGIITDKGVKMKIDVNEPKLLAEDVGSAGRVGTYISRVANSKDNPQDECTKFYLKNSKLKDDENQKKEIEKLLKCPCTMDRLGDNWVEAIARGPNSEIACFALVESFRGTLFKSKLNRLCCYNYVTPTDYTAAETLAAAKKSAMVAAGSPNAGHIILHDPFKTSASYKKSQKHDIIPHDECCGGGDKVKCSLYYKVRPHEACSKDSPFEIAVANGDPHITMMDGLRYTFNGLGEFIMMKAGDFELQTRFDKVMTKDGNMTNATVSVAYAAKDSKSSFQVELSDTEDSMVILVDKIDLTTDFYDKGSNYSNQIKGGLMIKHLVISQKPTLSVSFPAGVTLKIHVGIKSLEINFQVHKNLKGNLTGLLGNFNGNNTDDFILPDGTQLKENMTEREIFEDFGKKWEVTAQDTIFEYDEGKSQADYKHPNFEPIFLDEVDAATRKKAEEVCGGGDDLACIFDYVATKDEAFAANTKSGNEANDKEKESLKNSPPDVDVPAGLTNNGVWEIAPGGTVSLQVVGIDTDNDTVTFELDGTPKGVTLDAQKGTITYVVDSGSPVSISVKAVDSKGAVSPSLNIPVETCSGCSGNGTCDDPKRFKQYEAGQFKVLKCTCFPAYTGDDCENDIDGCFGDPCLKGQNCTDIPAEQQGNATLGFKCGPCPPGFTNSTDKCIDENECLTKATSGCSHGCANTQGSYMCTCDTGLRLGADQRTCEDINECTEKTHNCKQKCVNKPGSFSCDCETGYTLNGDGFSCDIDPSNAEVCGKKGCEQVCTVSNKVATCKCNTGYELDKDGINCTNIDECATKTAQCSQTCTDTDGGFNCTCFTGYKLGSDGISCDACQTSHYGDNCALKCQCNGQGDCDKVKGCVCETGWTGTKCNENVDECKDPKACKDDQICTDSDGSFDCSCRDGYVMNNNTCEDINECKDASNNDCDLALETCVNNVGSYVCDCLTGYAKNGSKCEDIDECARGISDCAQVCVNVPGKYNCKCYFGQKLAADRKACVEDKDVCANVQNLNCSHGCTLDVKTKQAYCFCPTGYKLGANNETCADIDECAAIDTNGCSYKAGCKNIDKGYECSCEAGSKLDNDQRTCVACGVGKWGKDCATDCSCGVGAEQCNATTGCVCKVGYNGTLCDTDIDECSNGQQSCTANEKCVNLPGSAKCECKDGYANATGSCEDIDECADSKLNDCNQVCNNTDGSYVCSCHDGFALNSKTKACEDIDECKLKTANCTHTCKNSAGKFRCSCPAGFKLDADGFTCKACTGFTFGTECSGTCTCNTTNSPSCDDVSGKCTCNSGWFGDDCNENDVDECADANLYNCTEYSTCNNTHGSYVCDCNDNFEMKNAKCVCSDGYAFDKSDSTCKDVDECKTSKPCDQECKNNVGSYDCSCNVGFKLNSTNSSACDACTDFTYDKECTKTCACDKANSESCDGVTAACTCKPQWKGAKCDEDVDECADSNLYSCTDYSTCNNTHGSYACDCNDNFEMKNAKCVCPDGYAFDKSDSTCNDVDECKTSKPCDQECKNNVGSYDCSCNDGFKINSTNPSACDACAEWAFGKDCSKNCTCDKANGASCDGVTGACTCKPQWKGAVCDEDVDECLIESTCAQNCTNTVGSFDCFCSTGYKVSSNDPTACDLSVEVKVSFNYDVKNNNLTKGSTDYDRIEDDLEKMLYSKLKETNPDLIRVEIKDMKKGSLVVDFLMIIKAIQGDAAYETATMKTASGALSDLARTVMTLDSQTVAAELKKINGEELPENFGECDLVNSLKGCVNDTVCKIDDNNDAVCISVTDASYDREERLTLILAVTLGSFVFLTMLIAIITCCCARNKRKMRSSDSDSSDNMSSDEVRKFHSVLARSMPVTMKNGGHYLNMPAGQQEYRPFGTGRAVSMYSHSSSGSDHIYDNKIKKAKRNGHDGGRNRSQSRTPPNEDNEARIPRPRVTLTKSAI